MRLEGAVRDQEWWAEGTWSRRARPL